MKYLVVISSLALLFLLTVNPCSAVVGCMESLEALVDRADIIVLGTVHDIKSIPVKCHSDEPLIPICRSLETLSVQISEYLEGAGPQQLRVRVAHNMLSLHCDDPYTLDTGSRVALFLRREGDNYVTVGDEGSLYPLSDDIEQSVRLAMALTKVTLSIDLSDMNPEPGQRVAVRHSLRNGGRSALELCVATPAWFLEGTEGTHGYRGWQDEYSNTECFGEVPPGGESLWVHKVPLIYVGQGAASIRASLQLYDRRHGSATFGTSFISSEPLRFAFRPVNQDQQY